MSAIDVPELQGTAQFQAQILQPNSTDINLDQVLVFKEASLKEDILSGEAQYTVTYASATTDFVEKVLKTCELGTNPQITFRYGYGQPNSMSWQPMQTGQIIQATSVPINIGNQAGHDVMLRMTNSLFTAARAIKTQIRKGLVSDIVAQIAAENRLTAVIEPTQNQYFYIQSYMDDVSFISGRLRPRATNAAGHGNYLFYVRDNVLHFHTPDYQATYQELNYFESSHLHMGQNNMGQLLWDAGVSGTRLISYDPYGGDTKELLSDPSKALRLADTLPRFSSVRLAERNVVYHLSENRPEESVNLAQNYYERARMEAFKCTVTSHKIASIRAGDFLNLVVSPATSRASTWSGVYLVTNTTYVIKEGGIMSSITLTRGETASSIGQLTTQGPNQQLVQNTAAPGHDLNLRDLQDSAKTKGAGQQTTTITYATIVDAKTLPTG